MESLKEIFGTPASIVIMILLGSVVFFLKRLLKSFDRMEGTVSEIGKAIVEHRTIVDTHEERIIRIEDKVFPTK